MPIKSFALLFRTRERFIATIMALLIGAVGSVGFLRTIGAEQPLGGSGDHSFSAVDHSTIFVSGWFEIILSLGLAVAFAAAVRDMASRYRRFEAATTSDALTGLANRGRCQDILSALVKDPGSGNDLAFVVVDVDNFKNINDVLGHDVGDLVLIEIAKRIDASVEKGSTIARIGGDEFAIVLTHPRVFRQVRDTAKTLIDAVAKPIVVNDKPVNASVCIGASYMAQGAYTPESLIKNADLALNAAKAAGRGSFRVFDPKLEKEKLLRFELERDLRDAIRNGSLMLHFQPMIDLRSEETAAYEALARWVHPRLGSIPPLQFIKLAEEIGAMRALGDWIVRKACETATSWPASVGVAINLSPQQFDGDGLLLLVQDILAQTGIDPGRVEFEITESLLISDKPRVAAILSELRSLGFRIALDDFGTGYSSMSYLHEFPIDKIKIDQSFVRDMAVRPEAAAIVESISFLARKLGLVTTAEGIETEAQAVFLSRLGCHEGQGYYFAKPFPADNCQHWLDTMLPAKRHIQKVA